MKMKFALMVSCCMFFVITTAREMEKEAKVNTEER